MKFCYTSLLLALSLSLHCQSLTIALTITNADCRANGSLLADVSGGSGDYRFDLSNDCGEMFPPQTNPNFAALSPCNYQLIVTDPSEGLTRTADFSVAGNEETLSALTEFDGCTVKISIQGGSPPYFLTYSVGRQAEVSAEVTDTLMLEDIGDDELTGVVTDDCGNSRPFSLDGKRNAVRSQRVDQDENGVQITGIGGKGPYQYTLVSTVGRFTNNSGFFPYDQVGCELRSEIAGACRNAPYTREFSLQSRVSIECINYAAGTLEASVSPPGIQPYLFTAEIGDSIITTTEEDMTGIPEGAGAVVLTAVDGCGVAIPGSSVITPNRIITPNSSFDCRDTSLVLFVDRTCTGEANLPINITCETCPDSPTVVQSAVGERVDFARGASMGNYELKITDGCGDQFSCRDTLVLELIPACDSIIATYVQRFNCDNGSISRRKIADGSLRFQLLDGEGRLIEADNRTGRFNNLSAGEYMVELSGDCQLIRRSVRLGGASSIDPTITLDPQYVEDDEGTCRLTYRTFIDQTEGPYELSSLDDPRIKFVLNDFGQDACSSFAVPLALPPGDYRLVSLRLCGEKMFTLPSLDENRISHVSILNTCPGNSLVEFTAMRRTAAMWREYFRGLGFNPSIKGSESDVYYVNGQRRTGDKLSNLPPGEYLLGLAAGFGSSTCFIDTMTFIVPEYEPVVLKVAGNYLCNNSGEAPVVLTPILGNPPYIIRQLDCDNTGTTTNEFLVAEGESAFLSVREIGIYCFVVEDDCGITSDFQVEVRNLVDRLAFSYECTPQVTLFSDSIAGRYTWFDEAGGVVGENSEVLIPASLQDRKFRLEIETDYCLLSGEIEVPGRPTIPELDLSVADGESEDLVLCGAEQRTVTAVTDAFSNLVWEGAAAGAQLRVTEPGTYTVVATNDLGCRMERSITFRRSEVPAPRIRPATDICPGDIARIGVEAEPGSSIRWAPGLESTDTILVRRDEVYTVVVSSEDGCIGRDSLFYSLPKPLQLSVATDSASCFGQPDGAVLVDGSGGTGSLDYLVADKRFMLPEVADNVAAGAYTVTLIDQNNCTKDTLIKIGQPDSLMLDLGPDLFPEFGDRVSVSLLTNADALTTIRTSTSLPDTNTIQYEGAIRFRAHQSFILEATIRDSRGCVASDLMQIIVERNMQLYAPTAFSPNGDGVNDHFMLQGRSEIAGITSLRVFDRWGGMVYEGGSLDLNDLNTGWDGNHPNGRPLSTGTYVWQAEVRFFDGTPQVLSGTINLLR